MSENAIHVSLGDQQYTISSDAKGGPVSAVVEQVDGDFVSVCKRPMSREELNAVITGLQSVELRGPIHYDAIDALVADVPTPLTMNVTGTVPSFNIESLSGADGMSATYSATGEDGVDSFVASAPSVSTIPVACTKNSNAR